VNEHPDALRLHVDVFPRDIDELRVARKSKEANERYRLVERPRALVLGARPEIKKLAGFEVTGVVGHVVLLKSSKGIADRLVDARNIQ